jgi:hypothetical protein
MTVRDKPGNAGSVYKFEWRAFWGLYDETPLLRPHAEAIIERIYARYAPNRKRPTLTLTDVGPTRRRRVKYAGYYEPQTHRIGSHVLILNNLYLTHEVVHSLSERDSWEPHGPEFLRNLIEVHCWRLKMAVAPRVRLARDVCGLRVADRFKLGRDPTRSR